MSKVHVKTGDTVVILSGKDRGMPTRRSTTSRFLHTLLLMVVLS